ncbi:TPA: hypothetical protein QDZ84_002886 [Shewanella algae]|uniref:phage baseplate assembly protein V n=1 Tax=Shewanella algae TaxID=38313 RepID=UPI001FB990E8|nr:phage baseplate assembly protein V [Shewanella algae]HDS1207859.1 hypothetical protein [Shewanella algae]
MEPVSNLLLGKHRCVVEDVSDPEELMRCRIRVMGLWDSLLVEQLPWAEYALPVGARPNDGDFKPCQVGDLVWCEFDRGDSRYPIITGSCFFAPGGTPNLPAESFAGDQSYKHKRTGAQPKPEPAKYHKDRVSTQFNFLIEQTASGAYRVTHKGTGTAVEITKDGQLVLHAEEDSFSSTEKNLLVEAMLQIKVIGRKQIWIRSDEANVKVEAATQCTVDAPKIHLNGGSGIVTTAHKCHYTGLNHGDGSSTCTAGY